MKETDEYKRVAVEVKKALKPKKKNEIIRQFVDVFIENHFLFQALSTAQKRIQELDSSLNKNDLHTNKELK